MAPRPPWWGTVLRGMAMGLADLVPGVSGGTVAFITGIYERLLNAINAGSDPRTYLPLLRGQIKRCWQAIDGPFLLPLGAGLLTALLLGATVLDELLTHHLPPLLAFFTGLTVSAAVHLVRTQGLLRPAAIVPMGIGLVVALAVQSGAPAALGEAPSLAVFFGAGVIALCVMILPGVSGSLLLLLLGVYPFLTAAASERDFVVLVTFAAGGIIGLALFARLLKRVLDRWPVPTIATLVGMMLGALPRLWPWRDGVEGVKPILHPPVLPGAVEDPRWMAVLVCLVAGLALVEAVAIVAGRLERRMADA